MLVIILIYLYIYVVEHRKVISGIVSIVSTSTLLVGLINYVNNEEVKNQQTNESNQKKYIDFISGSFDKIDNYYINNPSELHSLYYEFYGYNNFPEKYTNSKINNVTNNSINNNSINNNDETNNKNTDKTIDNITPIEYITLLKIIQYIEIMFIINKNIFTDLNFRNRIINYTSSKKFKRVLAYNKNNYSSAFLQKMEDLKIIINRDIEVENIPIPKLN
jgi:hypothetical protein